MADDTVSPQQLIDDAAKALGETPIADIPEKETKEEKIEQLAPPAETPRMEEPAILEEPPKTEDIIVPETPTPVVPSIPEPVVEPIIEPKKEEVPQVEISIPPKTTNIPLADITPLPPLPTPEPMVKEKEEEKLANIMPSQPTQEEQKTDTPPSPQKPKNKKGGKGILIATLLFFILTLPIAIYYVTQSPQFAEIRSRAASPCTRVNSATCRTITCDKSSEKACVGEKGDLQNICCKWTEPGQPTPTIRITLAPATATPTKKPGNEPKIIEKGCIGGEKRFIQKVGFSCNLCVHGGIMTCNGPTGGSGGDPCTVKYDNGDIKSVDCASIGMLRCNCGGDAWVGGWTGATCTQMCACAGISCDTCTPTPTRAPTNPPDTNTPTKKPTATPTGTTAPTATPTTTNTPAPGTCDASCDTDSNCESGLSCVTSTGVKRCRKSACPDETDCSCPSATATPTTYYANNTPVPTRVSLIASAPTATPTSQPTPKIPVAGIGPGIIGALSVAGSILLLLIGLAL